MYDVAKVKELTNYGGMHSLNWTSGLCPNTRTLHPSLQESLLSNLEHWISIFSLDTVRSTIEIAQDLIVWDCLSIRGNVLQLNGQSSILQKQHFVLKDILYTGHDYGYW